MGEKKRPLTEEEMDDRGWRREERRYAWTTGRGSPFQTSVAKLAHPPLDPASLRHILALAWTPHYAALLHDILNEARRDPGEDGFARATESAREVWNDIMGEPRNLGGWPERLNDKLMVWVNFNVALLRAQQSGKVVKAAAMKAFVKEDGRDQPWPVNTVPALRKILGQVERATSQEMRSELLSLYSKP